MSRELKIDHSDLAAEVTWLTRMTAAAAPASMVIQVTSLLNAVLLRRTNLDQYRESVLPAQGIGQATICVDAAKLAEGLRSVTGPLSISVGTDQLTIKSEKLTVRVKASTDMAFPEWPRFESTTEQAVVGARELVRVLTSVGTDETLPGLMAVAFDGGNMVTTDRVRLTRITYDDAGFTTKVPSAALRAFATNSGVVYVEPGSCAGESGDWVEISAGGRTLTTRTVDAEFPQWRRLIPKDPPLKVAVRRADLLEAAGGDDVHITVDGETMTVVADSDGVQVERSIDLQSTVRNTVDGPFTVTLRSRLLNDALRGTSSGVVLIEATEPNKPVAIKDVGESDLHLIMPVRTA